MKKIRHIFIFLIAIYCNSLFSQIQIREVDITGNSKNLKIDSILNVPNSFFDSIVLNHLTIPQEIEMISKCYGCTGSMFVSFITLNKKLIQTKIVRGIDNKMDSILLLQHKNTYNIIDKYSNFEKDKFYFITIAVRFEYIDGDDNILIKRIDSLGGRNFVLQKSRVDIKFKTDSMPINFIPNNINECLIQLDSVLTNATKNKIKTWDKEYYDFKTCYEFPKWIDQNWKILCGFTVYPEQKKVGLEKYFYDLGITKSCYINTIISNCYYRHLIGSNINFNEEITNNTKKQKNK